MLIKLVVGDWSGDGHSQKEDFWIDSNLSKRDVNKAYKKGCKILGFDISDEVEDYQKNDLPEEQVEVLNKFLKEKRLIVRELKELDNEGLDSELYVELWLAISKLGNPQFIYTFLQVDDIHIGGYGLFY